MKIFITKWWETRGIEEASGAVESSIVRRDTIILSVPGFGCLFYLGRDCFNTRKEAVEHVKEQARKKIVRLHDKMDELEKIFKNGL